MIHTVELTTKSSDFNSFLKFKNDKSLGYGYKYPGIKTIKAERIGTEPGEKQYLLKAEINLSRVTDPDNILGIYKGQNAEQTLDAINQSFEEMGLFPVWAWNLSEVHMAIDIHTPYVKEYIQMLHHGKLKHDPQYQDGSLYIPYSPNGITVNFYDKEAQQRSKGVEAAERARNKLRLEVQVKSKRLSTELKNASGRPTKDLVSLLLANDGEHLWDMMNNTIYKELVYIIGDTDHVTKEAAIRKIRQSKGKQQRTLEQLADIVSRVNRKGNSISSVQKSWCAATKRTTKTFQNRLDDLYRLNINPVCVPSDSSVTYLENLGQLYLTELAKEYTAAMAA